MAYELVLSLGDIIEVISHANSEYHQKTFLIDYIDDQSIEILDVTSGFKHILTLYETGYFTEESIKQIHLLSRAPEEGYAKQNGLTTGKWIDVHFAGEIPTVITGEITNVDEDMIEIITYPDTDVIYLNFEYKGIPKNLPIERIAIREKPKSVNGSLRQMVDAMEEGEILEFASMDYTETGEIAIVMPENPRLDPNFNEIMKELVFSTKDIIFGDEEEIEVRTEVKKSEQRYGIDIQLNDLLDELLSVIPTLKRTEQVMRRVYTVVRRFKELREKFSTFDDNGNVTGYKNFDAAYKPLAEHLSKMDRNLRWILPVVKQRTKLYNVDEGFIASEDAILKKTYINDLLEYENKKQTSGTYSTFYENINENMTPFESNSNVRVNTDLDAIVEQMDDYYSYVYNRVNRSYEVGTRKFVIQKYNVGLSKMHQHVMKSGKTVYLRGPMTQNDAIEAKSVIMLPSAAINFSRVDLPGTGIMDRVNMSHNWLYYYRLLKSNTEFQTIPSKREINYENGSKFLETAIDFDILPDDDKPYDKFLDNVIPRSRSLIYMMRDRVPDPYSFYNMISFFEPFLLYPDNITYSAKTIGDKKSGNDKKEGGSYQEIRFHVKEMVKKYKAEMANLGGKFGEMATKKYENEGKPAQNAIYRVLKENDEFLKMIKERYNETDIKHSSSESMNHLLNTDGGSAYMSTVSLMLGFLFKPDLSRLLIDGDADTDASLFKSKSCATRSIAKKYKSVTEMQKDNNTEDVYFDKEYDDTPYIIMSKYEEEKGKMLPDKFLEYFKMVLIEKHDANPEIVEEMAMNLIAKRRRVRTGNYAMLETEENAQKKSFFYVRRKNNWVREDIDEDTFCNLSENCYLNEDAKKKTCDSAESTKDRLKHKGLNMNRLDTVIALTTQDMETELKARAKYHLDLLRKIRWIKDSSARQHSIYAYMMGTQIIDSTIIESPYIKLRDYILGQSDFAKRNSDLLRFRDHFCREAVKTTDFSESEHWLYCVDTNSKLLPRFLYDLAYSYAVGNNYEDEMDRICRRIGKLSEDQESIVDKHSGYVIKSIDFMDEEGYNEAGFKISTRDILSQDAGESLLNSLVTGIDGRKTKSGKRVFEDINTQHIYNISSALCEYMSVDFDLVDDRIMPLAIEFVKNLDSIDAYKAKQEKAAKKNIKIASYQTYFDQNKIYFTACMTFVAIQTSIPSFTPNKTFPGCMFSFGGYPLDAGEENTIGLKYMACVIDNIKSSVEPWNSISNQKRDGILQRLMELMTKRIMMNANVADMYLHKKQYMLENPESDSIPAEHDVSKWTQFQPPIVQFSVIKTKDVHGLSNEFKEELADALKKGHKSQHEMLGTIYQKIVANSYGLVESVNAIVAIAGKDALLRAGSIVFLENACCEDDGQRRALDFFIKEDANIAKYIETVQTYSAIYNDTVTLCRAPYLFYPKIEGRKMLDEGKGTGKFSEEQIYSAFIHYCKLDVDAPVPDDLQMFYQEKPMMGKGTEGGTVDLLQMIEHLKKLGHTYTNKSLQDLMQIIAHRNVVEVDMTNVEIDNGILAFTDLIDHLSDQKTIEGPLANHLKKLIEQYKDGVLDKTDSKNSLKRYLMKANRTMLDVIIKYIVEFSSMKKRDKTRITEFLTNVGTWKELSDTELMFKSSQFIKNCIHSTTKTVPAMLQGKSDAIGMKNIGAMKHWELSQNHEMTIVRNITDYFGKLNAYHKDEMICQFFLDVETTLVNLNLFAENIPIFTDQKLLFDREITQLLYIYIYYSVFHDMIVESNSDEYVKVEMANVKLMRSKAQEDAEDEMQAAEAEEETEEIGDEYDILMGKKQEFKKRMCHLLTILIEMDMDNKAIININYAELSDKVYKASKMEKKTITDRFETMTMEERSVENAMKKYKMGAWNAGEEKGLFKYDSKTYDKEVAGKMMANEGADVAELRLMEEANADADADAEAYDIGILGENYEDGAYYEEDMENNE